MYDVRMDWHNFLKSMETPGGKMLVLVTLVVFFIAVAAVMVMTGHPLRETGRTLLSGAIGACLGILYGYLKANGK